MRKKDYVLKKPKHNLKKENLAKKIIAFKTHHSSEHLYLKKYRKKGHVIKLDLSLVLSFCFVCAFRINI